MATTDKLRALGLTIENEKKKEANSSERVGKTFGVAADAIDALDVKIDSKADSIAIQNDLQALENKIADATTNFKGYHISIEKLNEAYPSSGNKKDFFAWVGSSYPGTVWKVYSDNGEWTDTGKAPEQPKINLDEYAKNKNEKGEQVVYAKDGKIDLPENVLEIKSVKYVEIDNVNLEDGLYNVIDKKKITEDDFISNIKDKVYSGKFELIESIGDEARIYDVYGIESVKVTFRQSGKWENKVFFLNKDKQFAGYFVTSTGDLDDYNISIPKGTYFLAINKSQAYTFKLYGEVKYKSDVLGGGIVFSKVGYYYSNDFVLTQNNNDTAIATMYSIENAEKVNATLFASSLAQYCHILDKNKQRVRSVEIPKNNSSSDIEITINSEKEFYLAVNNYTTQKFNVDIKYKDVVENSEESDKYLIVYNNNNASYQTLISKDFSAIKKRKYENSSWSFWENAISSSHDTTIITSDTNTISPNDFKEGSQIERIQRAIDKASENNLKVIIPKKDTIENKDIWLIDSAILLPSNTNLELFGCKIKLSDTCRDNFMRTKNLMPNKTTIEIIKNINVIGFGNVVFEGANNPRSTGDWNKKISNNPSGAESFGTDAGKSNENQYGGWLNHGINLVEVENFHISGIHLQNYHGHGFVMDRARAGYVSDISFYADGYINGKRVHNQDGFGIRQGCRNITIEKCTGVTGDDFMNIGCLLYESGTSDHTTGNQNTHNPSGDIYRGEIDDTFNIIVQNIKGVVCKNGTRILRLMCSYKQKQYNITVQNIKCDTEGYIAFTRYQVDAGNNSLYYFNDISDKVYFTMESGSNVSNSIFQNITYRGSKNVMNNISETNGNILLNIRKV